MCIEVAGANDTVSPTAHSASMILPVTKVYGTEKRADPWKWHHAHIFAGLVLDRIYRDILGSRAWRPLEWGRGDDDKRFSRHLFAPFVAG